jgi:hypothetical protein
MRLSKPGAGRLLGGPGHFLSRDLLTLMTSYSSYSLSSNSMVCVCVCVLKFGEIMDSEEINH